MCFFFYYLIFIVLFNLLICLIKKLCKIASFIYFLQLNSIMSKIYCLIYVTNWFFSIYSDNKYCLALKFYISLTFLLIFFFHILGFYNPFMLSSPCYHLYHINKIILSEISFSLCTNISHSA